MNKLIENLLPAAAVAIALFAYPMNMAAQTSVRPALPVRELPKSPPPLPKPPAADSRILTDWPAYDSFERSIKVDPAVNLAFGCVIEGTVKINGWSRNEVRVFVANGNKFSFRTAQKNKAGEPVWIKVIGVDPKGKYGPESECLFGSEIEVDAPTGASIIIKGREISTSIDTVKKADVTSIGGSISLRNITNGATASAGLGDVSVEASQGAMNLETTQGNILVFDAAPSEFGDIFQAKTSGGTVSLQGLGYRQVNVNSVTGSVAYNGEILSGGSYNLRTSKGSIQLSIPAASSFQMWATYGFGDFSSELPVDIATENFAGPIKSIRGKAGKGDATLKLTTNNGNIVIRKL